MKKNRLFLSFAGLKQVVLLLTILLGFSLQSMATHISGGDLTYQHLGGYQYEVTLVLYRDCAGIPVQNPELITCTNASGSTVSFNVSLIPGTGNEITFPCFSTITTCNGGGAPGFQRYEYHGTVTLPASSNWKLKWEDCCRNCAITTISGGCNNSYLIEANLNNLIAPNDDSPYFTNYPVAFVCLGQNFTYNHGVVDSDGDSLSYSFINPRITGGNPVPFLSGYTATNFISSSTPITLNPNTGDINLTSSQLEVGITAILIEAFKNGVKVGSVMRDIQFQVQNCNPNVLPTATGINGTADFDTIVYANTPICFDIYTADANTDQTVSLNWNNAIPGATFTATNDQFPTGTFCWTPTAADARPQPYSFTVMVKDDNCAYNAFQVYSYQIFVPEIPKCNIHAGADFNSTNVCGTSTVTLMAGNGATTYGDSLVTYLWSTGETTPSITVTIDSTTSYSVNMNNSFFPCDDNFTINVNYPSTSDNTASGCNSYEWNGTTYTQSGAYTFSTLNSNGCDSTATLNLTIYSPSTDASSISGADSVVIGNSVTLNINGGNLGTNANWVWYADNCGGTPIGTGASIQVSPSVATTYYARAEGECNTSNCVSKSVGVIYCNPTGVTSNKTNNTICKGSSITLTVAGPINGTAVWKWYKSTCGPTSSTCSTNIAGTGASITVVPTTTTTYYVRAEGGVCGTTQCVSITVNVITTPASPCVISGPTTGLCNQSNVAYSVTNVPGVTYTWSVPTGATIASGQGTNSINVNFGTVISGTGTCSSGNVVCVKASNMCGTSAVRCLTVNLSPTAPTTITGSSTICKSQTGTYTCTSVFGATSYTWQAPTGWIIVSGQGTTTVSVKAGSCGGSLKVKANNACASSAFATKSISVKVCTKFENPDGNTFYIYPNPTNGELNFVMEGNPQRIEIYSILGEKVVDCSWTQKLDVSNLIEGVYLVRCYNENTVETTQLVIAK